MTFGEYVLDSMTDDELEYLRKECDESCKLVMSVQAIRVALGYVRQRNGM